MPDINKMIKWMSERKGKVTYSMNARLGPTSYDCSSAVYLALIAGGFLQQDKMGNTDSLFGDLEANGWQKVALNSKGYYEVKRGDIFIWGDRGASGGAAGHTGIFTDDKDTIIHCNYGYNGISVNDHDIIWGYNGKPPVTIYRYIGKGEQTTTPSKTNSVKPQLSSQSNKAQKVNQGIYRADDLQKVNGIWQVRCNFLVPTEFNWTDNGISVDDIVLVDSNGYILKDQTTKTGSLFVFNTNYIKSVSGAQTGSGNYKWCQVNLSHSGNIWLSVMDKNDLIHKVSNA
ncbi:peptidoglycan amidohydrolase family protein [Enterococcus sp. LJL99]